MFQFHPNWPSYRSTAKALRHHAFLYVADIVSYDKTLSDVIDWPRF